MVTQCIQAKTLSLSLIRFDKNQIFLASIISKANMSAACFTKSVCMFVSLFTEQIVNSKVKKSYLNLKLQMKKNYNMKQICIDTQKIKINKTVLNLGKKKLQRFHVFKELLFTFVVTSFICLQVQVTRKLNDYV